MSGKGQALFLDRDGTLIEDVGYPRHPDDVRLVAGVADSLRRLREAGLAPVVISNQSGIGRGFLDISDLESVHERMVELLEAEGAGVDGAFYCPHAPGDGCRCRKPGTELIERARTELKLSEEGCFFVGDKETDVEAGSSAGCRTLLLSSGNPATTATWHAVTWDEAEEILMSAMR